MCHLSMTTTLSKAPIPQKLPAGTYYTRATKGTHEVDAINVIRDDAISGALWAQWWRFIGL